MADDTLVPTVMPSVFGSPYVIALAVIAGPAPQTIFRLSRPETVVGRGVRADYVIEDSEVSSTHFSIEVTGTVCTIIDMGARNGTILNGKPMKPSSRDRLKPLDEIQIGKTRLLFTMCRFRD